MECVLIRNWSDVAARQFALARPCRSGRGARPPADWPGWYWPRSASRAPRRAAGGPPARSRCRSAIASAGEWMRTGLPRSRISPRSAGVRPKSVSASSVRPEPTRPASPRISPRFTASETSRIPAARLARPRSLEHHVADRHVALREDRGEFAAHHQADQLRAVHLRHRGACRWSGRRAAR